MSKHTPGPWRLEEADGAAYICMQVKALDGESLMGDERYYPWVPSNLADWHLIAAAPELLEALKDAASALRYIREAHGELYGVGFDRVETNSAAAIAKAEGAQ